MALFNADYAPAPYFNIRTVQAGSAEEMVTHLTAEIATALAAGESNALDLTVGGAGAGPLWEACLVTGSEVGGGQVFVPLNEAAIFAAVAGNPTQVALLLNQRLAASPLALSKVAKVTIAGGGLGPTYMAIALARLLGGG